MALWVLGFFLFFLFFLITVADSISVQVGVGRCVIGNDMNYELIRMVDVLSPTNTTGK